MAAWQTIDTIPTDREIEIVSAREIVCRAKVNPIMYIRQAGDYGPHRILCRRMDLESGCSGDIWARAWREIA